MANMSENTSTNAAFNNMAAAVSGLQEYLQNQHHQNTSSGSGSGSLSIKMPHFSGDERELASIWILQAEEAFQAKNISDDKKVSTAVTSIFGGALSWCLSSKQDLLKASAEGDQEPAFIKWSIFSQGLKEAFPAHNEQVELRKMLRSMRQTGRASEYAAKLRILCGLTKNMGECDALLNYAKGLKPETKAEVDYNSPETLKEAIEIATKFDSAFYGAANPERCFSYLDRSINDSHGGYAQRIPEPNPPFPGGLDYTQDYASRGFSRGRARGSHFRGGFFRGRGGRGRGRGRGRGGWQNSGGIWKRESADDKKKHLQKQLDLLNNACFNCHQTGHNSYDPDCPKNRAAGAQNVECGFSESE